MSSHEFYEREREIEYWYNKITVKYPNDEILRSEPIEPALDSLADDKEMEG